MRRPLLITLVACWLSLPAVAMAQAPRQTLDERWTTIEPATSFGRSFDADFFDPDDPDGKPHAIDRIFIRFHPGTTIDTTAIPRCEASDAELTLQGPAACPPDSKVGEDSIVADTGVAGPARFTTIDSGIFNGERELIFVATERLSGGRIVVRAPVRANTVDIRLPFVPGAPPDGAAITKEGGDFFEQAGYFTTPPTCPPSAEWTIEVTYTYRDGVSQTARDTLPCTNGNGRAREPAHRDCMPRRLRVTSLRIGPARLGDRLRALTQRYRVLRHGPRAVRFCVEGGGRFLVGDERGRIDFVSSTARGHATRRTGPGRPLKGARLEGVRRIRRALLVGTIRGRGPGRVAYGTRAGRTAYLAVVRRGEALRPLGLARQLRALGLRRKVQGDGRVP